MGLLTGVFIGAAVYAFLRCVLGGIYTVEQNERAVITSFGRAERLNGSGTLDEPMAASLDEEARSRYGYPKLRVIGPGGPYLKRPWQKVHKVNVAIETVNIAFDPDTPSANRHGTLLDAVTKDQLNIGMTGQLRYKVSEDNIYAYLFGVRNPIAHVMGYFISVLRERIANFSARPRTIELDVATGEGEEQITLEGVSINDLRKNLNRLNEEMDTECASSEARYGIVLDASLITQLDPPEKIEAALAAINTAHNEVSSDVSVAQALADQRIEQSKRAVEIETMRAEAEVEPLRQLAEQLALLKAGGSGDGAGLEAYRRKLRLDLLRRADLVIQEERA